MELCRVRRGSLPRRRRAGRRARGVAAPSGSDRGKRTRYAGHLCRWPTMTTERMAVVLSSAAGETKRIDFEPLPADDPATAERLESGGNPEDREVVNRVSADSPAPSLLSSRVAVRAGRARLHERAPGFGSRAAGALGRVRPIRSALPGGRAPESGRRLDAGPEHHAAAHRGRVESRIPPARRPGAANLRAPHGLALDARRARGRSSTARGSPGILIARPRLRHPPLSPRPTPRRDPASPRWGSAWRGRWGRRCSALEIRP